MAMGYILFSIDFVASDELLHNFYLHAKVLILNVDFSVCCKTKGWWTAFLNPE